MAFSFGPRRGVYLDIAEVLDPGEDPLPAQDLAHFETLDLIYRSLCALLYNYVPTSATRPWACTRCGHCATRWPA